MTDRPEPSETRTAAPELSRLRRQPPRLPDRWRLLRLIGRGGQGDVWLAKDGLLDQKVAIKAIPKHDDQEARAERTRREARFGRLLEHPHLVRVFDLQETDDHVVVVMEWLRHGSVRAGLAEDDSLPVDRVVEIAESTLGALAYLHEKGIVHRDIKASNLLVGDDGRTKVGDLGLVRSSAALSELTRTGTTVGTPLYMSPEQLRGASPAPPSDLYSLGVTLYRLLAGRHPFESSSEFEIANGHLNRRPVPVRRLRPDCPRWLSAFVQRLLEKRPADRWPDGRAALVDFRRRRSVLWRRIVARASVVVTLAAAVVISAWLAADAPPVSRVVVTEDAVTAVDAGGESLWSRRFEGAVRTAVVADLVGSDAPEVAVGLDRAGVDPDRLTAEVVLLGAGGEPLATREVGSRLVEMIALPVSDDVVWEKMWAIDLGDGQKPRLALTVRHPVWYPAGLFWWHPAAEGELATLLLNSGHIDEVISADVNGDGEHEILVAGINNQLGYQQFVAVIRGQPLDRGLAFSPDLVTEWGSEGGVSDLLSYSLLGPHTNRVTIRTAGPDGLEVERDGKLERLTPWGVPLDSPLAGPPPSRLVEYWRDLAEECQKVYGGVRQTVLPELAQRHPVALADPRVEVATRLVVARSQAAAGLLEPAIETLADAGELHRRFSDLDLRRGELLLIRGDRARGREAVLESLGTGPAGRGAFDAMLILGFDAALAVDREALRRAGDAGRGSSARWAEQFGRLIAPVYAFYEGAWHDPSLAQESPMERLLPPLAVLKLWAGLERGELTPAEVAAALDSAAANPETRHVAGVLQAVVEERQGRTREALGDARQALEEIRRRARTDFMSFAFLPLAELVYGEVLLATGEEAEGCPHLEKAARLAPRTWVGRAAEERLAGCR